VVVDGDEYRLHLSPSGILYEDKTCVIGNGVVVEPGVLCAELDYLHGKKRRIGSLRISDCAHLVMPYHRCLDEIAEESRGADKIGTTGRGIGPAYMDKAARVGLRVGDLLDPEGFRRQLQRNLERVNPLLQKMYNRPGFDPDELAAEYLGYAEQLRPYIADTSLVIDEAIRQGKNVLFEGAQGTLLDNDHGTYPFVTSSHPVAGGACIGAGVGPTKIDKVIGVAKAYTSRVGDGPFPTELFDDVGAWIREQGQEYGTTTGRPRRCGWLDAVILRYAARLSGLSGLAVTRLDTLSGLPTLKICTGYLYKGERLTEFPHRLEVLRECQPVYEEMPGWQEDISHLNSYEALPETAKRYLQRIVELVGVPIALISIGRERAQTIGLEDAF
jgi:adenylosuccinate synthase